MSGADLRDASIKGYDNILKNLLKTQANPCSRDKMSLCSLHYAAWNGHVECIKLLISNPHGVDSNGERASALQFASCLGYTALHLVALDSPSQTAYEVTMLLLLAGLDQTATDMEGKTPFQLAEENGRSEVLRAFADYKAAMDGDEELKETLRKMKANLLKHYCFQVRNTAKTATSLKNAGFDIPDFLLNDKKAAPKPPGMAIHEEHIKPLIEEGFYEMDGMQSYACLHFSKQQALLNKDRREALILADPSRKSNSSS